MQAHPAPAYGLNELVKHIIHTNTPTRMIMATLASHHLGTTHSLQDILLDILQQPETHHPQDILPDTLGMEWTFEDQCLHFPAKPP